MIVIAMTNELGTLSKAVADQLAERLGVVHVLHHNETRDFGQRIPRAKDAGREPAEGNVIRPSRFRGDRPALRQSLAREVLEIAAHGNVLIRGCCAPAILRDVGHVLRVRVAAPMQLRAPVVMRSFDTRDEPAAAKLIRQADARYADLIEDCFGVNVKSPCLYDVTLNTERLTVDECVEQLSRLAKSPAFQPTAASGLMLDALLTEARQIDPGGPVVGSDPIVVGKPRSVEAGPAAPDELMPIEAQLSRAEEALYGAHTSSRAYAAAPADPDRQPQVFKPCWD